MPNPALKRRVRRYQRSVHRAETAQHTRSAFASLQPLLVQAQAAGRPLHLDSCCGVGASTVRWAQQHPDAFVLGVDKSAHRLGKHDAYREAGVLNYEIVRADCASLWRLLVEAGWRFEQHNLWYPNPWPKSTQRARRWYAMPALVPLLALQRQLSVRSNCLWYLEEFAWALRWWGLDPTVGPLVVKGRAMTPFEAKYAAAGQPLWVLACDFPAVVDAIEAL